MESRIAVTLSVDNFVSPSADSNSASSPSSFSAVATDAEAARGTAASSLIEVSPLSYQSSRSRPGGSRRGSRSHHLAASTGDIEVPLLAAMPRQLSPASLFSSPVGTTAVVSPTFSRTHHGTRNDSGRREGPSPVEPLDSSQSQRDSLHVMEAGTMEHDTYLPPRCYHLERLVYTGVFVGFLFRSYYIGCIFFRQHMPQLRRGVGEPNRLLAALLPTIGYDGGLDRQWMSFLHSLPSLFLLSAALGAATHLLRYAARPRRRDAATPPSSLRVPQLTLSDRDVARLLPYLYGVVGLSFVAIVHGPHFFVPLLLTLANYVVFSRLQRWCPYWVFMTVMWTTHVSLLFIIELYEGFEHTYWLQYYFPTDEALATRVLGRPAKPLWSTHLRWYVAFRMTTLRLIAFNYDLWEATHSAARARERAAAKHDTACIECAQLREQNNNSASSLPAEASRCYKYRTECPRDPSDYSFVNYLAYVVFPPLYLAGPMSSFNAFVSYMRVPGTSVSWRKMGAYGCRTGALLLVAFVHLHFWFIVALSERIDLLVSASPEFQSYILYYYLAYIWLKFSFIWKSSRLFAMFSGIEVPEDMPRCFSNTTTVRNFWRDWHASFNLWIVRYMYVPMGGRARVALSVLPIFLFIALWHDPALHLLKWALCIAAMFVVELLVSASFHRVSAVFRREMATAAAAAAAATVGATNGSVGGNDAVERSHLVSPRSTTSRSLLSTCTRPVALWAKSHLTPFQRGTVHRQLVTIGCFFSVFGLIVSNMVGFCVQNTAAEVKDTSATDALIWRALRTAHVRYYLGLFTILYSASGIGVSMWFWDAITTRQLRAKYSLKVNADASTDESKM